MATFILLLTLTPEGQAKALHDPEYLIDAENAIDVPGVQTLGIYGVLGQYDFVALLEADRNEDEDEVSPEMEAKGDKTAGSVTSAPSSKEGTATE